MRLAKCSLRPTFWDANCAPSSTTSRFAGLYVNQSFRHIRPHGRAIRWRRLIPRYVKDYVPAQPIHVGRHIGSADTGAHRFAALVSTVNKLPDRNRGSNGSPSPSSKFMDGLWTRTRALNRQAGTLTSSTALSVSVGPNCSPPQMGGRTINLYGEAIGQMTPEHPSAAAVRDIFKNAYLPYRDPGRCRFPENRRPLPLRPLRSWAMPSNTCSRCSAARATLGSSAPAPPDRFHRQHRQPSKHGRLLDPACGTAGFCRSQRGRHPRIKTAGAPRRPAHGERARQTGQRASSVYDISPDMGVCRW